MWIQNHFVKVIQGALTLLAFAGPALAGGGEVMPATASPKDFSLLKAASATAFYNVAQFVGLRVAAPPVPFQVLTGDTTVKPGTMLYLPVFFADDSATPVPGFPADVTDQAADAAYLDDLVLNGFGVEAFLVEVDGRVTVLNDAYISGVTTSPLPDGPPDGTHYIVSAAFLTPLTPGKHTVSVGGIIDGEPVVFLSYTVNVR